jgi:hypothetical protein
MQQDLRVEAGKDSKGNDGVRLSIGSQSVGLDPKTLSDLIATLARLRSRMSPPIEWKEPNAGGPIEALDDPSWYLQPATDSAVMILTLRHPGYGQMHFALPQKSYLLLQERLSAQLERANAQPGTNA